MPAKFPGGGMSWLKWMAHKQEYPERAVEHNIQGEVRVVFNLDTVGRTQDPILLRSVEYSLDLEDGRNDRGWRNHRIQPAIWVYLQAPLAVIADISYYRVGDPIFDLFFFGFAFL